MRPNPILRVLVASSAIVLAGCSSTEPDAVETIDVDAFIDVYIDLRLSALQTSDSEILPEERQRILTEHGLEETDLLEFVDVHGRETIFMQEVWDSVEVRLRRAGDSVNTIVRSEPPAS